MVQTLKMVKKVMIIQNNKQINYFLRKEQGMALALVLVFTATLLVLGTAVMTYAVNESLITGYNKNDIRLYYIVEAGLETGIAVLNDDFLAEGQLNGGTGEGTFIVHFSSEYEHYSENHLDHENEEYYLNQAEVRFIRSIGTLGEHSKVMTAAVTQDEEGYLCILRWYGILPYH